MDVTCDLFDVARTVLGVAASVIVYGVMSYTERGIIIKQLVADAGHNASLTTTTTAAVAAAAGAAETEGAAAAVEAVALIDWGFYVAAGGAVVALLASLVFFCDGRRSASESRYETAATMEI